MKKVVLGILLLLITLSLLVAYNHRQPPTEKDVFNMTKKWSNPTEEVLFVRKIDGKWLTTFRLQQVVTIAELQQNWLGIWKLRDNNTLSTIDYPPLLENPKERQIIWSASGKGKENEAYYFGIVTDPEIDKITIETQKGFSENVPFIKYQGTRFFLKRADGDIILPVNISGFSKSGELIYSSLKKVIRTGE